MLSPEWQNLDVKSRKVLYEFSKDPLHNIFIVNLPFLLDNVDAYKFDVNWIFKPGQFAQDIYGVQYWYPIVLLVNGIGTIFDFHPDVIDKILAPRVDVIEELLRRIKLPQ